MLASGHYLHERILTMSVIRQFFCTSVLALSMMSASAAMAETNVLFIVDASGSMKKEVDGKPRMDVAKNVLKETLDSMPKDAQLGLLLYGHRKAKDCKDIELAAPIGGEDAAAIGKMITDLTPKGETPIADSLRQAAKSFKAFKGQQNSIILVTDGVEECKGDPCKAAQELKDAGLDVAVNIVGFTLGEKEGQALQCVSDITGGKYYSASNAEGLTDALKQVQQKVQETVIVQTAQPPKASNDILSAKNGGTLVYAPNAQWQTINSGKFERPTYDGEAVWSFKDGKPGTFDQIEVLVDGADNYNLKDFEVLAADELAGPYRSLGEFTVQNVKVMPEGWQGFKFAETTAKFVKVVYKTGYGSYIKGHAMKLIGKIDESAAAVEASKLEGTDILSSKNGGKLVYAPNVKWETINTGKFEGATYEGEGVWSFKDGKPASFDRIEVLVDGVDQYNLREFEVLAGDDPYGDFRSVGTFSIQNAKVMPDGWQRFTFAPVTGKYVKIVFINPQGSSYVKGHAIRLFGKIDEAASAAEKPAELAGKNLLAQSAGGTLLVSPGDAWAAINDGKPERSATYNGQAVFAFEGEKPAMIEAVDVLTLGADKYNLKDFEVLVGDEGPTGQFRSIGNFTVRNVKVMPDGYQRFTFPKVKAKYIKFDLKTDQGGGYIAVHEFRVIGTLEQ